MRHSLAALVASALLGAAIGCNNTGDSVPGAPAMDSVAIGNDFIPFNPQDRPADTIIRRDQQFEDIPVPIGFNLHRDRMFSFQGTSYRYGKFVYEGLGTRRQTGAFFREQMPVHDWELFRENDQYPPNGETLRFRRGNELAEISIQSLERTMLIQIVIRDSRRPDPTVLASARMNAPSVTPGSITIGNTEAGKPYRAPIYVDRSPSEVMAYSGSSTVAVSSERVVAGANPTLPTPAPAWSFQEFPTSSNPVDMGYSVPGAPVMTTTSSAVPPGTYLRRVEMTRSTNGIVPFNSLQGRAIDPRTFQMDMPTDVGIRIP